MRILVISTLYPPVAFGGYEVECSSVVEHLREHRRGARAEQQHRFVLKLLSRSRYVVNWHG